MAEKIVDARGQLCPIPLIMTKKALQEIATGDTLRILIDNEISKNNVERFLADNGFISTTRSDAGVYSITVAKSKSDFSKPAAAYCAPPEKKTRGHVIVISGQTMGTGPEELGGILLKAFVNTIKEVQPLPSAIVFYNSGILLALEGSPLVDSLKELEAGGVAVLVCGTCVNYFNKKDFVRVGVISNMYTILETLNTATTVIRP